MKKKSRQRMKAGGFSGSWNQTVNGDLQGCCQNADLVQRNRLLAVFPVLDNRFGASAFIAAGFTKLALGELHGLTVGGDDFGDGHAVTPPCVDSTSSKERFQEREDNGNQEQIIDFYIHGCRTTFPLLEYLRLVV